MKRFLSIILSVIIIVGVIPAIDITAFAATTGTTADGFEYEIADGEVTITDYTGSATEVVIPETIEGYPVTLIGAWSFYDYTSLTVVTIPDSVTHISHYAFRGCNNLTSVTIPRNLATINYAAFYGCTSLTSITIPGSVTYMGQLAFRNCTSLTDVYYGGTKEQWGNIPYSYGKEDLLNANIYYNAYEKGITATLKKDDTTCLFTVQNKQAFAGIEFNGITSGEVNSKVSNASAEYNNETHTLSQDGLSVLLENVETNIAFKATGYYQYIIPKAVLSSWKNTSLQDFSVYMSKDKKDGKTYISSVFARNCADRGEQRYLDISTEKLELLNGKKTDVIITAVEKDSPVKAYYLSQDEAHKISDSDGIFSAMDLYSVFDENKDVYAYAVLENGKTTEPVSLSLKKEVTSSAAADFLEACNSGTVSLMGSDGFKITLSDDIPLVGGAEISTGLGSLPVGIEIENERVRISIGVDVFSNEINGKSDTKWFDFKETCKSINKSVSETTEKMKAYRNLLTASQFGTVEQKPSKKLNFDGKILGYIEAYIIDGEIVFKEVSGTLALEFFFNYKQQFLIAGIPAIYAYVKAGAEGSASITSGRAIPDKNMPFEFDVAASITPSVKIGGGVGVKDAVSAGIWGKGSMPVGYNFTDTHFTLGLQGEIGLEAEFFVLKGDVTLLDGSVNLIDHYFNSSKKPYSEQSVTDSSNNTVDVFRDGEVSLADRSYLENTSAWLGGASSGNLRRAITAESVTISDLQTSVYKNSQTQLVQFGDTMMMVWIEDCADRDAYNRMRLVYSVYDTSANMWSEPKPVADNGTSDAAPSLATDGENVYVAWQNIDYTISTADSETVDILMDNAEIRLAKYNAESGEFENAITVTDNATYDYAPKVTVNKGKAEVYWVNSSSGDFAAGTLSIHKSDFAGSSETVLSGLNYIHNVDSDGTDVSYTMDKDGDTSTTTDIKVYTNGSQVSVDYENAETSCLYAAYAMLDGEKVLFYVDDYNLCYIQDGEEKMVFESPRAINGNLQICNNGTETTAMWLEAGESGTEIYTCSYENGKWTAPVQLTNLSKVLSNVAITYNNGKIYGLFNRTHLEEVTSEVDGSIYYKNGSTDLCQFTTEGFNDIALSLMEVDESQFVSGQDAAFKILVSNNGTEDISSISFEITDGNGYSQTIEKTVDLPSGSSEFVELTYTVPETVSKTEISVYASIAADVDEYDNTVSESIGGTDLSIGDLKIEFVGGVYIVSGIVTNNNGVTAENVMLNAYLGDAVADNLYASNIGTIEPHGSVKVEFMISQSLLDFSEKSYYDVTLKVEASEEERISYNNEAVTVITETGVHTHNYGDWTVDKKATCTEEGSKYQECDGCDDKIIETIPATGHTTVIDKAVGPTCTATGLTEGSHCSSCGDILVEQQVIEALGHNVVLDPAVAPTVTEFGLTEGYHCSNCGLVFSEQELIRPLGYTVCLDSEKIFAGYDDTLVYEVEETGVTYQWYATNNADGTRAVAVKGATDSEFSPMDYYGGKEAKYKYFYCVANFEVDGVKLQTTSPMCINAFAFVGETDYSYIDYENAVIYTDSLNNSTYTDILTLESAEGLTATVSPSYQYGEAKGYGTGSTLTLAGDGGTTVFTVVVYGDINGDGAVDVLDGTAIARAATGNTDIDGIYGTAADIDGSGDINPADYQSAINKILAA